MPIRFRNVHYYRISGRYTFAGDLFIVRGAIYFFPEVDLARQRSQSAESVPHNFAWAVWMVVYLAQKVSSYVSRNDLWKEGMSDEQFRVQADAYIEKLKGEWGHKDFAEALPLPIRVSAGEISGMKLSLLGRLSFLAQSDNHDFNVGLSRRRRLRKALWERGLGRV
jgi:hypothetical protein